MSRRPPKVDVTTRKRGWTRRVGVATQRPGFAKILKGNWRKATCKSIKMRSVGSRQNERITTGKGGGRTSSFVNGGVAFKAGSHMPRRGSADRFRPPLT